MAGNRILCRRPLLLLTTGRVWVVNRWLVGMCHCFIRSFLPVIILSLPISSHAANFLSIVTWSHASLNPNATYIGFRAGYLTSVLCIVVCVRDKIDIR